jgi:predicted nucleic acid-binding protein
LAVPTGVVAEISDHRIRSQIESWPHVEVVILDESWALSLRTYSLDKGETECLTWALRHPECIFLTDDLAARNTAKALNIAVHGTVGILLYAAQHRWLTKQQTEESLHLLYQRSSLFVTFAIIENAIRALRASD